MFKQLPIDVECLISPNHMVKVINLTIQSFVCPKNRTRVAEEMEIKAGDSKSGYFFLISAVLPPVMAATN